MQKLKFILNIVINIYNLYSTAAVPLQYIYIGIYSNYALVD